jgi:hypothetical protein
VQAQLSLPSLAQPFVTGSTPTPVGAVPTISADLKAADMWGTFKARWGVGRMHYKVDPGLYALRRPDQNSPVLVTANYKMSFDSLRASLQGRDAWILVLNTDGINVWCAAGKGSFGTAELVAHIESSGLPQVVAHRKLILPQLSAPGVAAHRVKDLSGFRVIYGPVKSSDLSEFMDAEFKARPEMRRKTFDLWERVVVVPVELVQALRATVVILAAMILVSGLGGPSGFWQNAIHYGSAAAMSLLCSVIAGAVLAPILLPWLPGRAFAVKGLVLSIPITTLVILWRIWYGPPTVGRLEMCAWILLIPALITYLAMNFTGASTYTSLSGVKKEMRWALPLEMAAGAAGVCFWLASVFVR